MGKKYIVEIKEGERLYKTKLNALNEPVIREIICEPYTEPNMEQVRKEAYDKAFEDAEQVAESGKRAMYQKGLKDAWEAARKICTNWVLPDSVLSEIFGMGKTIDDIMKENTASEVIAKIRAYEQEKDEEIRVGDEVVGTYTGEEETEPFVIIRKIPETHPTYYFGIYSKSGEFCQGGLELKKTGRHFPEIAEVLRKMKEADNG